MEPVYDVGSSYDGKGQIIATKEGIGQNVFVCDSKNGNVIKATITADIHNIKSKSQMGVIEITRRLDREAGTYQTVCDRFNVI